MPNKRATVKNEKQYEALKDKGMSKERAVANSPGASSPQGFPRASPRTRRRRLRGRVKCASASLRAMTS
jgi:hypothetical protein